MIATFLVIMQRPSSDPFNLFFDAGGNDRGDIKTSHCFIRPPNYCARIKNTLTNLLLYDGLSPHPLPHATISDLFQAEIRISTWVNISGWWPPARFGRYARAILEHQPGRQVVLGWRLKSPHKQINRRSR